MQKLTLKDELDKESTVSILEIVQMEEEKEVSSILEHTTQHGAMEDKYSMRKIGKTDFYTKSRKILKGNP
jgi:hypothetical protein